MASVLQNRATTAILLGDGQTATASLARAAQLAPAAPDLQVESGAALAFEGAIDSARAVLANRSLDPSTSANLLLEWAVALESAGAASSEQRALHAASALCPGKERYEIPLVRMLLQTGQYGEADTRLEGAREAGLDANVYWAHRAWLLAARGDQAAAASLVERLGSSNALADRRVAATLELMDRALAEPGTPPPPTAPPPRASH